MLVIVLGEAIRAVQTLVLHARYHYSRKHFHHGHANGNTMMIAQVSQALGRDWFSPSKARIFDSFDLKDGSNVFWQPRFWLLGRKYNAQARRSGPEMTGHCLTREHEILEDSNHYCFPAGH